MFAGDDVGSGGLELPVKWETVYDVIVDESLSYVWWSPSSEKVMCCAQTVTMNSSMTNSSLKNSSVSLMNSSVTDSSSTWSTNPNTTNTTRSQCQEHNCSCLPNGTAVLSAAFPGAEAQINSSSCNCTCRQTMSAQCSGLNCSCSSFGIASTMSPLGLDCGCKCRPSLDLWEPARATAMHVTIPRDLRPRQQYQLTFPLRNPGTAQASPPVKIEVQGAVPIYVALVAKPASAPPATAVRAPLAVVSSFLAANSSISQSTPNAGEANTLRITFASRDSMRASDHINITISGLAGAQAPADGLVPIELATGYRTLLVRLY